MTSNELWSKIAMLSITISAGILKNRKLVRPPKTEFDFFIMMAVNNYEDVGPGITLHILNRSVNSSSEINLFSWIKIFLKTPIWAIGPPKLVSPKYIHIFLTEFYEISFELTLLIIRSIFWLEFSPFAYSF